MDIMDVSKARYFTAIAEHRNLSEAARHLHVTQPALSSFLKAAEMELDCKLFIQSGRKLLPTEAGLRCIEASKKVLEISADLDYQLKSLKNSKGPSRFRIGMTLNYGAVALAQLLTTYAREYPECAISLDTYPTAEDIEEQLDNGVIDFGIALTQNTKPLNHISSRTIWEREIVLIAPDHPAYLRKSVTMPGRSFPYLELSQLSNEPFLIYNEPIFFDIAKRLFTKAQIAPRVIRVSNEENLYTVMRCGYGVSIHAFEPNGLNYPTYGAVTTPTVLRVYAPSPDPEYVYYRALWRTAESDYEFIRTALSAISNTKRVFTQRWSEC